MAVFKKKARRYEFNKLIVYDLFFIKTQEANKVTDLNVRLLS